MPQPSSNHTATLMVNPEETQNGKRTPTSEATLDTAP